MRRVLAIRRVLCAGALFAAAASTARAETPKNLFANGGFEQGQSAWKLDKARGTIASFAVDRDEAAAGGYSARVTVGKVAEWGVQFGQRMAGGKKGTTWTLAGMARAVAGSPSVRLEIERAAKPWDRAARTAAVRLSKDKWTELHVTFTVGKDFPEGWFAYISCSVADCGFRVDGMRLYEGNFVPLAEEAKQAQAIAGVRVFDVRLASSAPLTGEAVAKRTGWVAVAGGKRDHAFAGDAAVANDRLAVVFRRAGAGAEVYSLDGAPPALRATLAPAAATALADVRVIANDPSESTIEATHRAAGGKTTKLTYTLRMGQVYVATAGPAEAALRVAAPCRFVVLPDFFADDLVLDATSLPVRRAELPADHFLLHLLDRRDAIVAVVRSVAEGDVSIALDGMGTAKTVTASEVPYGAKGTVSVAVLAATDVWHRHDVAAGDTDRETRLDWTAPFPAAWRLDWRRDDGLTDSWAMIAQRRDGRYAKYDWLGSASTIPANRKRWTTVLGSFRYPCWLDRSLRGHVQPLKRGVRWRGPAVIYPMARARETPAEAFTLVDIVRATLGVGPCEYILDVEGQRSVYKGIATCGCRSTLNPIYKAGRQRRQRAKIQKTLLDVVIFIRFIRSRIEQYVAFGQAVRAYLAAQRKAHPELAVHLDALDAAARQIDRRYAARKAKIRTPADAAKLADKFRATMLDYEGPDAYKKCRVFTEAWVSIGSDQDELVGECRWAVKVLRQRAALAVATEPRMAEVAREVRRRSHIVLRSPASHEGAGH